MNAGHMDGPGCLIVGSRDIHLLACKIGRLVLVVQFISNFLGGVVQNVPGALLDAVLGTRLLEHRVIRIFIYHAFFFQHHRV